MIDTSSVGPTCHRCGTLITAGMQVLWNGGHPFHLACAGPTYDPSMTPPLTREDVRQVIREEIDQWLKLAFPGTRFDVCQFCRGTGRIREGK